MTRYIETQNIFDESCISKIAETIASDITKSLENKPRCIFLASGGQSPAPILSALSNIDIDWSRVLVSLTDERCVISTNSKTKKNSYLVEKYLLQGYASDAKFINLWNDNDISPESAATRANRMFKNVVTLDVALLGMGPDGHIASIFSSGTNMTMALESHQKFISTNPDPLPPEAPWPRITMTLSSLASCTASHLLLFGGKEEKFYQFIENDSLKTPVAQFVRLAGPRLSLHICNNIR